MQLSSKQDICLTKSEKRFLKSAFHIESHTCLILEKHQVKLYNNFGTFIQTVII